MEWKTVKLGDVGTIVGGATPLTKNAAYYDGDIAWITPKDLANHSHRYISRGERNITEDGFRSCSCKMMPKGSILFSSRAPIGYIAIAENDLCTNQGFKSIIPDADKIDNIFLFYLLNYHKDYIAGLGSGTTFMEVSGSVMKNIEVKIPSLKTQHRIAAILSSLDDKIENNNRINRNLEAQAQALFKSWFVDFEPWGGTMPEDWKEGTLGDIIVEIESGSRPKGGAQISGIPSIGAEKIERFGVYDFSGEKYVSDEFFNKMKRGHVNDGDVMLYKDGAYTGKCSMALDGFPYKECAVNEHVFLLRTEEAKYQFYLYLNMIQESVRSMIYTLACSKAAQPGLNTSEVLGVKTIIPTEAVMMDFNSKVANMMHTIANNCLESARLATLRDTLLPKLMKGEIAVA